MVWRSLCLAATEPPLPHIVTLQSRGFAASACKCLLGGIHPLAIYNDIHYSPA